YPSDMPVNNPAFAYLVTSGIAKGRITRLDLKDAQSVPGVLDILTHENTSELKSGRFGPGSSTSIDQLGPAIPPDGPIISVVLADSYEAAREAAYKVRPTYAPAQPSASFGSEGVLVEDATKVSQQKELPNKGNAAAALATAEVTIEAEYATPTQHHNALELF